jgi:transcriptional regulator with PAS, ATPase and Fis domain
MAKRVDSVPLAAGDVVRVGSFVGVVTRTPGKVKELAPGLLGGAMLEAALIPLEQAATSELPLILEGETGTGKEVVASSLHHWSGRKGRFIAVNCAALPEGLAEAELFGYRRGAFTGADKAQAGLFRDAQQGTLLLDEVSDLPLGVQAKLLRVLEQREVVPLGETRPVKIDVRIVVAGQESLLNAVKEGRFRADLLARLEGVNVRLPALRQRKEDVPGLFVQLLAEHWAPPPEVSVDLIERLCIHDWPFNVRELVNLVKKLVVFHGGLAKVTARQLPDRIRLGNASLPTPAPPDTEAAIPKRATLEDLMRALQQAGGNVTQAARQLGITRQRAYRLLEAGAVDLTTLRLDDPQR